MRLVVRPAASRPALVRPVLVEEDVVVRHWLVLNDDFVASLSFGEDELADLLVCVFDV